MTEIKSLINPTFTDPNKFNLVFFYRRGSSACEKLFPVLEAAQGAYNVYFYQMKVCSCSTSSRYKINAVPTIILFKGNKEIVRHTGLLNESELNIFILHNIIKN